MNDRRLNLGLVESLTAESFGEPGSRTFRLLAATPSGEVGLWLEKEQLVALSLAVKRILERVPDPQGMTPRPVTRAAEVSGEVRAKVGSLSLAFDRVQDAFVFEATDLDEATLDVQTLLLLATRGHLSRIQEQVDEIIAGGRPRCVMCGRPMGPGPHFCPPSNGHAHVEAPG